MLYRVFPSRAGATPTEEGGALYVPRARQGSGRHDNPDHYGALYAARSPESAIAERVQGFRGQPLTGADLRLADGRRWALGAIDEARLSPLVDLDDPSQLAHRRLRPSMVATRDRSTTREIARAIFAEGLPGFSWWSTLESSWTNVTLFAEVAVPHLEVIGDPEPLSIGLPALRSAADLLGITVRR
ncbi:MAG: RES family NAD+ phosphorylase [Acidimicrobiia bacterium]